MSLKTSLRASAAAAALFVLAPLAVDAATLTGRVSDSTGSINFAGAEVRIESLGRTVYTNRDGVFRFSDIPAGTYDVSVRYIGAEPATRSVTVRDTAISNLVFNIGDDVAPIENVLVVGQSAAASNALNRRRSADALLDAITADNIGNFPDQNVSEAARRIVGVSVENDQGEGRYVVIRGMNADLNTTSINGLRIGAPESDVRRVALDVVPSDLVSAIEIAKTVTPDMDGDSIGGAINIETASAFERDGLFFSARAEGSYNNLVDEYSPRLSAAFSNTFSETFGMSAAVSWFDRDFGSDNKEVDGGFPEEGGIVFPEELELRDYDVNRERIGINLNFDFRPNEDTDLYVRSVYNDFSDYEFRNRTEFKVEDDPVSGTATSARFTDEFEIDRDSKDRLETQKIFAVSTGGEFRMDRWTLEGAAGYSRGSEKEPGRIDADFRRTFNEDGSEPFFDVTLDYADPRSPTAIFNNEATRALVFDPSQYEFDELVLEDNFSKEEEFSFKLDMSYDTTFGAYPGLIKFGGKVRLRDKENNADARIFDGFADDLTLADVLTTQDYGLDNFGPSADQNAVRAIVEGRLGDFELAAEDTAIDSAANDYEASEDVYAAYIMGRVDIDALRIIGGLRVEWTDFKSSGNEISLNDGDLVAITPISDENSYTDFIPSLALKYDVTDDVIARFGASRTIARPNIADVVTRIEIEETEDGEFEGTAGNPNLDPYKSLNIDASLEYYPTRLSILSAGVFYKDIKDFIVDADLAGTTGFERFDEVTVPINGDAADLLGFEVGYSQQFDFLPAPFDGIIVGANYTYVDSEATLRDGREISFPGQSENIWNANLGYEKGPFSFRAAFAYRDDYLDVLDEGEAAGVDADRFVDSHFQIDLSAKYQVTDQFQVYLEASNINDEPFVAYFNDERFLSQFEEYDYTIYMGVRFTY